MHRLKTLLWWLLAAPLLLAWTLVLVVIWCVLLAATWVEDISRG